MIDLKEFLRDHNLILDDDRCNAIETYRILQSRNRLLSAARGSIREHLQQQLTTALRRFNEEAPPTDPQKIS
ncbi:MAG: hypothetical protein WA705_15570 [Candidatus Ozemobacteraceae bacterium]